MTFDVRTPTWRRAGVVLILGLSSLVLAGTVGAETVRETVPAADAVFFDPDDIECLGEEVTVTGKVRMTTQGTIDANGVSHILFTSQARGVKAIGSESGTIWLLRGQTKVAYKGVEDPETGEVAYSNFRFMNVFRVVGRAGSPTSVDHLVLHTTADPKTGEITTRVDHVQSTCQ